MLRRIGLLAIALSACTSTSTVAPGTTSPEPVATATSSISEPTATSRPTPTTTAPAVTPSTLDPDTLEIESFPVPSGSRPHDVAPALDGGVWYSAQGSGDLGWLDPATGETRHIDLGVGSRPHGVIVDADGTAWVTDGGLNAIVRVDPANDEVAVFPLPSDAPDANLNTAAFDGEGLLWFTGQKGIYGSLDPDTGVIDVYEAPGGRGPYGITSTPSGNVAYASLAGSYVGSILSGGEVDILGPATPDQGARRVWADSGGDLWVAEWNTGAVSRYEVDGGEWSTWVLPGETPAAYAVYVDDTDIVWLTDFGGDAIVRFDPDSETFTVYSLPHSGGNVRQLLGRPGEVWGAESGADHLVVIRTR